MHFFFLCRAAVHIQVNDVNEFAPVFRESEYRASVTEGKIYDNILQVEASDQDCSPQYSQICNYQITSARTPFAIDRNGESDPLLGGLPLLYWLTTRRPTRLKVRWRQRSSALPQ